LQNIFYEILVKKNLTRTSSESGITMFMQNAWGKFHGWLAARWAVLLLWYRKHKQKLHSVRIVNHVGKGATYMAATFNVGHQDMMTIAYLDQNGNPMLVTPTPDHPPAWTNAPVPAGCDTLLATADGSSATVTGVAVGQDTITLTVVVGGKSFVATDSITITAAPQVLTSVAVVDNVS
jgi:hypothetical protein